MPFGFRSRRRRKKQLEEERLEIRSEYQKRIEKIPSEYPYFCRKCLYQSKKRERTCPVCGAKMSRVGHEDRDDDREPAPHTTEHDRETGDEHETMDEVTAGRARQERSGARKRRKPARRRKMPRSRSSPTTSTSTTSSPTTSTSTTSSPTSRSGTATRTGRSARPSATAQPAQQQARAATAAPISTVGVRCEICDQRRPDIRHQCGAGFCLPCLRRWFNMLPPAMQRKRLCPECNRKLEIGLKLVLEKE